MKKLLLALAVISAPAFAEDTDILFCEEASSLAETAAQARYAGVEYSTMYKQAVDSKIALVVLDMAFNLPDYKSLSHQEHETAKLKNKVFRLCLRELKKLHLSN